MRSWTWRTTAARTSGSVSGSTPWPRLKTWPGRPGARRRATSRTSALERPPAARRAGPGRGCPAARSRPPTRGTRVGERAAGSRRRRRRRRPRPSAAAARRCRRRSGSAARRGRPATPRRAAECGMHVARGSRRATARPTHESKSWTARRAGLDLHLQERRRDVGEPWRISASQSVRVAVHQRLGVLVVLATGRPRRGRTRG